MRHTKDFDFSPSSNSRFSVLKFILFACLLLPVAAQAGWQQLYAPGTVVLSDVKKGQFVVYSITYFPVDDSDDQVVGGWDGEMGVASATASITGSATTYTVDANFKKISVLTVATQDAPVITVTMKYSGTGPVGQDYDDGGVSVVWYGVDKASGEPPCDAMCGDPINALSGNSFQKEIDYQGAGDFPLSFVRYYNSINSGTLSAIGTAWSHTYNQYTDSAKSIYRADGPKYAVTGFGLEDDAPVKQVTFAGDPSRVAEYLNKQTNILETYDLSTGRLLELFDLKGNKHILAYDTSGRLSSVTHTNGRSLQFTYDANNRIATMTDPASNVYTYGYDANNNLTSVTYPDLTTRQYKYNNASFVHAMTSLIDEKANTYATWTYDSNGFALSSSVGGGLIVETASSPNVNGEPNVITYSSGTTKAIIPAVINGKFLPGVVTTTSADGTSFVSHSSTYDSAGNVVERTNNNGSIDCMTYNNKHQEIVARFNATISGGECVTLSSASYYTTADWHPALYAKIASRDPNKTVNIYYHALSDPTNGNLPANCISPIDPATNNHLNIVCKTVETSTTGSVPARVYTFTYDPYGHVTTVTDPLGKLSTYQYYQDTTIDHNFGDLQSVTNAVGQTLTFSKYDKNGRVRQSTDANGLTTTTNYDFRGNVLTRTVGALTTTYTYWPNGQVKTFTAPDSSKITYTYDAAHRLATTTDFANNSINYGYDTIGNVNSIVLKDGLGNVVKSTQYTFDFMNNVVKSIGGQK